MERTKRWQKMVDKYGTEEAARAEMSRRAAASTRNQAGTGGFHALDEATRQAIARKGGYARAEKIRTQKQNQTGGESPTENEDPADGKDAGR